MDVGCGRVNWCGMHVGSGVFVGRRSVVRTSHGYDGSSQSCGQEQAQDLQEEELWINTRGERSRPFCRSLTRNCMVHASG